MQPKTIRTLFCIGTIAMCVVYMVTSFLASKCMADGKPKCMSTSGAMACVTGLVASSCVAAVAWQLRQGAGGP